MTSGLYGFSRDGGLSDIAGVSITHDDPGGLGCDSVAYRVPEPGTAMPVAAGLVSLARRAGPGRDG